MKLSKRVAFILLAGVLLLFYYMYKLENVDVTNNYMYALENMKVSDKVTSDVLKYMAPSLERNATLIILVLSNRSAFDYREAIRQTWSCGHENVFFMVGQHYCPYPAEQRIAGTCLAKNETVSGSVERLKEYLREKREKERLQNEPYVVILPVADTNITGKLKEAYKWVLQVSNARWILTVHDDSFVLIKSLEDYLNENFAHQDHVILGSVAQENNINFPVGSVGYVVSRPIIQYISDNINTLVDYNKEDVSVGAWIDNSPLKHTVKWMNSSSMTNHGNCNDISKLVIGNNVSSTRMHLCAPYLKQTCHEQEAQTGIPIKISEPAAKYLCSARFDIFIKAVYAYFYHVNGGLVPEPFLHAYIQHIEIWNGFDEGNKHSELDFLYAFHHLIRSIDHKGFSDLKSKILVDKNGFLINGAHRMAATVVLSKNATFKYLDFEHEYRFKWNYTHLLRRGLSKTLIDTVVLEWMSIQRKLPQLKKKIFILSLFQNDIQKYESVSDIVITKCSEDYNIFYRHEISVNKLGMKQLLRHMYGYEHALEQMLLKFKLSTHIIRFIFFIGRSPHELKDCQYEIRNVYNDKNFNTSAHITSNTEESLVLAEMILNPSSVHFLNYASNGDDCQTIATELALRLSIKPISTLPGLYIGRDDIMIDSDSVFHLYNLDNRTDVDILFLHEIDKNVLGNRNGIHIDGHALAENTTYVGPASGEGHVKTKWDLFYDPDNYGFCYGIKFVFLKELSSKLKRSDL